MSQQNPVPGQGTFLVNDIVVTGWFLPPEVISAPLASNCVPQSERPKVSRQSGPAPCAVVGCKAVDWLAGNTRHRVPRDEPLRSVWLERIGLQPSDKRKTLTVCARHFAPEDYYRNPQIMEKLGIAGRAVLKPEAIPTLHLRAGPAEESSRERVRRTVRSALANGHSFPVLDTAAAITVAEVPPASAPIRCDVGTQMVTIQHTLGTQTSQRGRIAATQVHMGATMQFSVATQTEAAASRRKRRRRRRVRR